MQTKAVREYGIVANFHCPSTSGTHPGVIVIGGAGGGLGSTSAVGSLLAEQGYADLSNSARLSTTFGGHTRRKRLGKSQIVCLVGRFHVSL